MGLKFSFTVAAPSYRTREMVEKKKFAADLTFFSDEFLKQRHKSLHATHIILH